MIPGCLEALVFDAEFDGLVLFEQAESHPPQGGHVFSAIVFAEAGLILAECHIEDPVGRVFDAPVRAHGPIEESRCALCAGDVITGLDAIDNQKKIRDCRRFLEVGVDKKTERCDPNG